MLCVPYFSEVWIIDHSTTTAQAATSRGGNANRGGDLLYRIGNRAAYGRGEAEDQLLFFPHNAHWTNEFLPPNHPFAGQVVCYNNRVGEDFSAVEIFETSYNMYIRDYELVAGVFPPLQMENTITHPTPQAIYSTGLSSAQLLPNGNTLICAGRKGYLVELTPENEVVWEYKVPFLRGQPIDRMTILEENDNLTFSAFRYPPDYSAFADRDLSPKSFLELNPDEDYCEFLTPVSAPSVQMLKLWPNVAQDRVQLTWESGGEAIDLRIYDLQGRLRQQHTAQGGRHYLNVSELESGLYLVSLNGEVVRKLVVE
ncbi:MAG: T9SS C-terminal target domain-containing protein [Bacteroidetes bacterium]|nr:MAG: T9SS C-terminal target domain-containing protein [Bacteroidota bacterium]